MHVEVKIKLSEQGSKKFKLKLEVKLKNNRGFTKIFRSEAGDEFAKNGEKTFESENEA